MIETGDSKTAIILAAQASGQALCVFGPPGCGKSRLINLAWASRHPGVSLVDHGPVSLNIDDSVDAKSLVGTFRSSLTEPGRFEWVDGLLVDVIKKGRWLVLEDLDRVNPDILSILPRQGDSVFSIPETGEQVAINPSFGLLGTSTIVSVDRLRKHLPSWLMLESGFPCNLGDILAESLPIPVAALVYSAYTAVTSSSASKGQSERALGLHDLFRAARRVARKLPQLRISESTTFITDFQKTQIGLELVDVFAAHSPFVERRDQLIDLLESALECSSLLPDSCPAFSADAASLSVGDVSVQRLVGLVEGETRGRNEFTLTSVHLQALRRVAKAVNSGEGVLVVGDTGVGKTTTIQFLSAELGARMHVYNFSDQTEGADLIGGLKPVLEIEKIVALCHSLISTTLPVSPATAAVVDYISAKAAKRDIDGLIKAVEKTALKAIALLPEGSEGQTEWKSLMKTCVASGKVFRFVDGPLVKAVRNGDWILLDEINLAPPDVLRMLNGLLENKTIVIPETGEVIVMHEKFRIFAAMNPPHLGRGKRALVSSLRARFIEFFCPDVTERADLVKLVHRSLERDLAVATLASVVPRIVDLYLKLKAPETATQLSNLEGGPPVFSLRSLSRAMQFAKRLLRSPFRAAAGDGTTELVDGLKVALTSAVDARSESIIVGLIHSAFAVTAAPGSKATASEELKWENDWVRVEGQWVACGGADLDESALKKFVVTKSVRKNLKKIAVCLAGGRVARPPVLCEGTTGAGKTSLVTFIAAASRHRLVRINNHEHTDLQDYFGQYVSTSDGSLRFQEGPLVTAVRSGDWVLLDELNLAPTEVLEALNRLLDDNRELVIPETGEAIKAHPDFVLFASQNPVTLDYAGRKSLSRAFRNRFVDIQIDDLPADELGVILSVKCKIAASTATRMLATYTELSRLRRLDRVLSGRDSALVTVRDLLRWAKRAPTTRDEIALEGYLVLAERLRTADQRLLVQRVLEDKVGVKNLVDVVRDFYASKSEQVWRSVGGHESMVRTAALNRALALVARAIECGESLLLVGETGTGKTSAVQLVAALFQQQLRILNCHQHLESGDLLGQVGPAAAGRLAWKDGPLVEAARSGSWVLLDEVNLADDSVIERLNSLLDVDFRAITLAEKPGEETVVAAPDFRLLCTMNPGNDFGKKELSAALRNRFTEIWIESVSFESEGETGWLLVQSALHMEDVAVRNSATTTICRCMHAAIKIGIDVSSRDALLWASFVSTASQASLEEMLSHGAALVLLDGLDPLSPEYCGIVAFLQESLSNMRQVVTNEWQKDRVTGPFPVAPTATLATGSFSLKAPTSALNFGRLVRAMHGNRRPILLHGDPGAGKSSVVAALTKYSGVSLVRINLSDQTELADILGQSVPDPLDGKKFVWQDGILLQAIARGDWVLLDELNLAPQPVLEGLNALLDHRAEVYVPAIDRVVKCPESFRLFATQNEARKGDGRKMLPRSLLSRFSRIRVAAMQLEDLAVAATESMHGDERVVKTAVSIISDLSCVDGIEFDWNLRDISRLIKCCKKHGFSPHVVWMVLGSRIPANHPKLAEAKSVVARHMDVQELGWEDPSVFMHESVFRCVSRQDVIVSQASAVAAISVAITSGCHVVVTGESGSGKQSAIRLLAAEKLATPPKNPADDICVVYDEEFFDYPVPVAPRKKRSAAEKRGPFYDHEVYEEQGFVDVYSDVSDDEMFMPRAYPPPTAEYWPAPTEEEVDPRDPAMMYPKYELRMHSQMDTSDLIGQFVQAADGGFVWRDSLLTSAVRTGGWVTLLNAHCCPPAILDRLNALIEDNGVLVIPEKGVAETIVPHYCFRLILVTEKPQLLSHAIRNRCVEVSVGVCDNVPLYDKVRVALCAHREGPRDVLTRLAYSLPTVRQVFQASLLLKAGLPCEEAVSFVSGGSAVAPLEESAIDALAPVVIGSVTNRESVMKNMSHGSEWFYMSSRHELEFECRMSYLAGGEMGNEYDVQQLCHDAWGLEPVHFRLAMKAILCGERMAQDTDWSRGQLHAVLRDRFTFDETDWSESSAHLNEGLVDTCHDLIVKETDAKPNLQFTGAFRQQSEDLFEAILVASTNAAVPTAALIDFAASAIVLRASKEESAIANEAKILATVRALAQDSEFQTAADSEPMREGETTIRELVEQVLRLTGVVDIDVLLRCKCLLSEHDLVQAGLTRAVAWGEDGVCENEEFFTRQMNTIAVMDKSVSGSIHSAIESTSRIACGDIGSTVALFKELLSVVKPTAAVPASDSTTSYSVASLVTEIRAIQLAEKDKHVLRREAIDDLTTEIEGTHEEAAAFETFKDASSVGLDGSAAREWITILETTKSTIDAKGVFVRPSGSGIYTRLRHLVMELQSRLPEIVKQKQVKTLVSFVQTLASPEYRLYRDVTREFSLPILRLVVALREVPQTTGQPIVPIAREAGLNSTDCLEWRSIERSLGLATSNLSDEKLRASISAAVVELELKNAIDPEEQVIVRAGVEITLASLVEDNDAARADAAVEKLRKELFPETSRKFLSQLADRDDFFMDEAGDDDVPAVMTDSELDKLAIALVADEQVGLSSFIAKLAERAMRSSTVGDSVELVAVNKLRLELTVAELEAMASAPVAVAATPEPEAATGEEKWDNRELKLRLAEFVKSGEAGVSFYSPGGGRDAVRMLSRPLLLAKQLLDTLVAVDEIRDHPDLVSTVVVVDKALMLPADCSAICALQAGEYVLDCLERLERSIPSRYWSDAAKMGGSLLTSQLMTVIARLRASEVASWHALRDIREAVIAKSGAGKWFVHLWRLANEAPAAEHFDVVLSWLRNSGVGQFDFRLELLSAVAALTTSPVLLHAVNVASLWASAVRGEVKAARTELKKHVQALVKEIQFRLGGRHYSGAKFRMDTKRSHAQLASVLKRFEESLSARVEDVVGHSRLTSRKAGDVEIAVAIRETMESIRSAPIDKSAKSLKQRLLADITAEVRDYLKPRCEKLTTREFSPSFIMNELVVATPPSAEAAGIVLSKSMGLALMPPVCKNQDVKPATLTEWRSLSAHSVALFSASSQRAETKALETQRRSWLECADAVVTDVQVLISALEWIDNAKLVVEQFNLLSSDAKLAIESVIVPVSLMAQLGKSEILVDSSFVTTVLPEHIETLVRGVYDNSAVAELFPSSESRFSKQRLSGESIAARLRRVTLTELPTADVAEESGDVEPVGDAVLAVLDFTTFLHDEGLCSKEPQEESTEDGKTEWNHGTGLGDGSGVNDKSDEIEDAGQFDTDRNEQKEDRNEGDDEEDDLSKGVDANKDQGMNEEDVEEHNMPRPDEDEDGEEKDENEDREMGKVDLDDGGKIDESGAPNDEDDEEDEEVESGTDEVELKNQKQQNKDQGEEETRANEKKSGQSAPNDEEGKEAEEEEGEGEDEGEDDGSGEDGSDDGEENESFEAFVDPKQSGEADSDEMEDNDDSNEINEDDIDAMDTEDIDGEEEERVENEPLPEEDQEDAESPVDGTSKKEAEVDEKTDEEQAAADEGMDSAPGTSAGEQEKQNQSDAQQQQASPQDGQQGSGSNAAGTNDSSSFDQAGGDFSNASNIKKKESSRPAPSPLEPNSSEALDEWLKDIREVVDRNSKQDNSADPATGDVGQKQDDSSQTALAAANEAVSGQVNDEEMPETAEGTKDAEAGEGVDRDDVVVDADMADEPEAETEVTAEDLTDQAEPNSESTKKEKKISATTAVTEDPSVIPETHSELPPALPVPVVDSVVSPSSVSFTDAELAACELRASRLTSDLSEKLMAVLEPTKRGRLEGFFKTGKRVSMRRVLSWIASDYRKDKFWLRRTRPSNRDYKVVICLDNTLSMRNNGVGEMSLVCVSALSQSLQLLEVGKVGVLSFGTDVREIFPLEENSRSNASVCELAKTFTFNEESTSSFSDAFPAVVHKCAEAFKHSDQSGGSLALIITDGRFDKDRCRPYVQDLIAEGHVPVLIVMDANKDESILSVTSVHFEEDSASKRRKIIRKPFLSQTDCPFPFYAVIQDPAQLPGTLSDILRQWIEVSTA